VIWIIAGLADHCNFSSHHQMAGIAFPALVSGSPLEWLNSGKIVCPRCGMPLQDKFDFVGGDDEWALLCQACDWETPSGGGYESEPNGVSGTACGSSLTRIHIQDLELERFNHVVSLAAVHAQKARFEHGERR
jgi:hypothetical protein